MTTLANLRAAILELIPWDRFVPASDIVATLTVYPMKALWPVLLLLAQDGLIECDRPGTCDGHAFVRRIR